MKYSKYKYKFKVEENFSIELPFKIPDFVHPYASLKDGILSVKRGYAWDGASGPIINTRDTLVASLVHDVLYQAMRLNLIESSKENRKIADKNFFEILKMHGVNSIRRKVWFVQENTRKIKYRALRIIENKGFVWYISHR